MPSEYFYLDLYTKTLEVIYTGVAITANHTGATSDPSVHRVFLTKGQYNKLVSALSQKQPRS